MMAQGGSTTWPDEDRPEFTSSPRRRKRMMIVSDGRSGGAQIGRPTSGGNSPTFAPPPSL